MIAKIMHPDYRTDLEKGGKKEEKKGKIYPFASRSV